MQLLSMGVERLLEAIHFQDKVTIEQVKGIGKKMAEKILLELKDKHFEGVSLALSTSKVSPTQTSLPPDTRERIKTTLVGMGYLPKEVDRVLQSLPEGMADATAIIPYAIKELS
ncbi:MAG: hypothetical protein H6767_04845 [Candidatus Peribacteria bacterium]|nr:MAG: hypothetical protein H6767_04845 [Candidatus Peribacteria bacterium]